MPLSRLPRLPRETSMLYTIGRVDRSGRVTNRGITDAVRLAARRPARDDPHPQRRRLLPSSRRAPPRSAQALHRASPVTARRLLSITPGDELLLAAAPEYRIVITHTMQALEDMLASFYAQIAADELPQP